MEYLKNYPIKSDPYIDSIEEYFSEINESKIADWVLLVPKIKKLDTGVKKPAVSKPKVSSLDKPQIPKPKVLSLEKPKVPNSKSTEEKK